jgi:hypothetical protein
MTAETSLFISLLRYLLVYQICIQLTCLFPVMCVRLYLGRIMIIIPQQCVTRYHRLWYCSALSFIILFHSSISNLCFTDKGRIYLLILFLCNLYETTASLFVMWFLMKCIPLFCGVKLSSLFPYHELFLFSFALLFLEDDPFAQKIHMG